MKTIKILFLLTGLSISTMGFGAQLGNTSGRTPKEDERLKADVTERDKGIHQLLKKKK